MLVTKLGKSFFNNHLVTKAERCASLRLLLAGVCVLAIINSIINQPWESRRVKVSSSSIIQNGIIMMHQNTSRINGASATTTAAAPEKLPLFIGAGQGTTGTRSMYRAFCHLGIPSVHWDSYCIDKKLSSSDNGDSGGDGESLLSDPRTTLTSTTGIEHHNQAIETYLRIGNCAILHRRRLKDKNVVEESITCTKEEFDNLSTKLHFHIAQVVKSGVFASLHDVPYTQMVPYIMEIAQQESIPTLLILSERNSTKWVASRTSHHATQTDVVCPDVEHAFDITYCLKKWKVNRLSNNNTDRSSSNNDIGDMTNLFRAYNEFEEGSDEQVKFLDFATKAMASYQEKIQSMSPSYHVNFWTESVNDITLPEKIWLSINDLISPHAKKVFIWQSRDFGLTNIKDNKAVASYKQLDSIRHVEIKIPNTDTA